MFGDKIKCNDVRKMNHMSYLYNKNYGFKYPENVEEFEYKLKENTMQYLVTKGVYK